MNSFYLDLPNAAVIETPDFLTAQAVVPYIARTSGLGVIHGVAGVGKTFAVDSATQALDTPARCVEFPPRVTPKQLVAELVHGITGVEPRGTRDELMRELLDLLSGEQLLLKVDEAQRLDHHCIETLRYLFDHRATRLGLLLVGGHGCWETVSRYPMVRSRVSGTTRFAPLEEHHVAALIPQLHPSCAGATKDVLLHVDRQFAHGNLRSWTTFLALAYEDIGDAALTRADADAVLALLGGTTDG